MKIGICGYGNLGRGADLAARQYADAETVGIFTRRDPRSLSSETGAPVYGVEALARFRDKLDVLLLCGGSATDLAEMTPRLAADFDVIDSFDTHARIREHIARVDAAAKAGGRLALVSVGWDPGLFSLARAYMQVLPQVQTYTFWGRGVSQGHSDAARRVDGVADARAYTLPNEAVYAAVRRGETPAVGAAEMHRRVCYVVPEENADPVQISTAIRALPLYFAGYDTQIVYITKEEMAREHAKLPHGGSVIGIGRTGDGNAEQMSFSLALDSNPEFTGSVLLAYARALCRMKRTGAVGCKSVLDVPPALLLPEETAGIDLL